MRIMCMLKESFVLSVLVLSSSFILGAPSSVEGICSDLGITKQEAINYGFLPNISKALREREDILRRSSDRKYWETVWEREYRNRVLPRLRQECNNNVGFQTRIQNIRFDQLQASIDASNKQNVAQMEGLEQRLDRLVLCNTKLIEFLAQKDHAIASTQDALTLVDKSKQLLEEELISKSERIAFLENALKSLKEKMEELAVENESIRAELEASIQGLQLQLKLKQ